MGGLNYKIEHRAFGFDKTQTKHYVATAQRGGTIEFDKVVEQIAIRTQLSKAVCRAVVDTMAEAMGTWLLEGHGVALGSLGYIKPSITCKSAITRGEEEIVRKKVLFQPGKEFKALIDSMRVELIPSDDDAASGGGTTEGGGSGTDPDEGTGFE